MSSRDGDPNRAPRALLPYVPLVGTVVVLGYTTTREVFEKSGRPAVPLDDAYIHFQYARAIAELHPFRYTPGATATPGATSLLWPALLAPFHALGLHHERLIWAAWALGFAALALTAKETHRLALGLVPRGAALAAGAMVLAFGGFAWFAASGMEVVPFAWLLTRTARRAAEWVERADDGPGYGELLGLAALSPLMRPEGALASLFVVAALAVRPHRSRLLVLPVLATPLLPSLVCLLFTGEPVVSTALAKWLPMNPYYAGSRLPRAVLGNVGLFFSTLLDGRLWTSVFLPEGGRAVGVLALLSLPVAGFRRGLWARTAFVLLLALGALIPTTYETFLVNRVRYIWPFATGWFVALATLADAVGSLLSRPLARAGATAEQGALVAAGTCVGLFAARLSPSIEDVAESAHAVSLQQVSLSEWARDALPPNARLGVNDTGALAYFSDRATFDIVGLTTAGEARYWTAGAGSRFEHYEHLPRERLPTHFVVYPEWMGLDAVLGEELAFRSVRHTILGGVTMAAYQARYDLLGSGDRPDPPPDRKLLDALDVADLESEATHGYRLLLATKEEDVVVQDAEHADGARTTRSRDRFRMRLSPGGVFVARWGALEPRRLTVTADHRPLGIASLRAAPWQEVSLDVPEELPAGEHDVEVMAEAGTFDSLHYWSYE